VHNEEKLENAITTATKLHGHLGPFLVIGVMMGRTAQKTLNTGEDKELHATATVPLQPPFSCVLDGIQASTQCTIGNQRLRLTNSTKEITAFFQTQDTKKTLELSVNSWIIDDLLSELSKGASNEDLAWKIARTPEEQLFRIKRR